jgi:hypothetical protein
MFASSCTPKFLCGEAARFLYVGAVPPVWLVVLSQGLQDVLLLLQVMMPPGVLMDASAENLVEAVVGAVKRAAELYKCHSLRRACANATRDVLAVMTGARPGVMLDYVVVPAAAVCSLLHELAHLHPQAGGETAYHDCMQHSVPLKSIIACLDS